MTTPILTLQACYDRIDRALSLLEKPGKGIGGSSWIQYAEAITPSGIHCAPESEQADAWCVIGVLKAVSAHDPDPQASYCYLYSLLNLANTQLVAIGGSGLQGAAPTLNDHAYDFATVRQLFTNAKHWITSHA